MEPKWFFTDRLVKSEDLNHHNTLFAGRCAAWFVESGFIAAASTLPPENIVCLKIHGLTFTHPVKSGEIARFESKVIQAGRSSLKVFIKLRLSHHQAPLVTGFITFVHVDEKGRAKPHGLVVHHSDPDDQRLQTEAETLQ